MAKNKQKTRAKPFIMIKFKSQRREKKVFLPYDARWGVEDLTGKGMKTLIIKVMGSPIWMANFDEIEYFYEGNFGQKL